MYSTEGYQALRHAAAFVQRGDRAVLRVTGGDRLSWLQGLLTNDVTALPPGGSCYSAYLTPQGRMITDLRVVNLADAVLLDVPASLAEALRTKLDALLFAEDAVIEFQKDGAGAMRIVELHGPSAPDVSARTREDLIAFGCAITRADDFGVPGVAIYAPVAREQDVTALLADAGAVATTLETLDVLRIERGVPAFLVDMDDQTIPLEAGIEDRAISFTKGCYVGQEVIVRVVHRGQGRVAKKLVGLLLPKDSAPHAGDRVVAGAREIGRVTSAAWSPALERPIALAYVHRDFLEPGTAVHVASTQGQVPATVTLLPFA